MTQLPDLHVSFTANGDGPKNQSDPIQIMNRIIDQLDLDFKRGNLLEFDVSLPHPDPTKRIVLVHREKVNAAVQGPEELSHS